MQILNKNGKYIIAFDPLDGSSNLDCNVSVGSIFTIWKRTVEGPLEMNEENVNDCLRSGREAIAGIYGFYGASTVMMICFAGIVNGFTLDVSNFLFILSHPEVTVSKKGSIYSVNEANYKHWDEPTSRFINEFKEGECSLRYIGSMVSDVHRTLLYGGIFMYPADKKVSNLALTAEL